jgi:hypothetical protein
VDWSNKTGEFLALLLLMFLESLKWWRVMMMPSL